MVWEGVQDFFGDKPKKSRQDNPVNLMAFQILQYATVAVEVVAGKVMCGDVQLLGAFRHIGILSVIDDGVHLYGVARCKIFADALCVSAVARREDG